MESKEFQDATSFLPWPKVNRQSSGLVSLQKTIGKFEFQIEIIFYTMP